MYIVEFLNEKHQLVRKAFESYYLCRKFVNRLKHSKTCTLICYPNFSE